MTKEKSLSTFKEKAALVSAVIHEIDTMDQAFEITTKLCMEKEPLKQLMATGEDTDSVQPGEDGQSMPAGTIAAPNIDDTLFTAFDALCIKNKIRLLKQGIRSYPGGIDIGFSLVDYGIAETGTLVLNSDLEETRLATMLCEIHVAVLKKSTIRETALGMTKELKDLTCRPSSYTAFITGASRTADIERVLALGVHGPLELHILLLED